MPYAFCTLNIKLNGCETLKQKRSVLSALLTRLKKYNLSVIESAYHDSLTQIELELVLIRANNKLLDQEFINLTEFFEKEFPNLFLFGFEKEIYI